MALPLARTLLPVAIGGALLLPSLAPRIASACSCIPITEVIWPGPDVEVPVNAFLLVDESCGGAIDYLQVFVDDELAALQHDPGGALLGQGVRIEPAPPEGATVRIESCPDLQSCEAAAEANGGDPIEGEVVVEYVVGARDDQAPAAPSLVDFDYVLEPEAFVGECGEIEQEPQPARDWTVMMRGEAASDETLLYEVSVGPEGGIASVRTRVATGPAELSLTLRRFEEDAGSNVCATIRTFDMAGNEAEEVRSCQELSRRDTLDGGCGCTSGERGREGWAGAGLMLLFGAWGRRRHGAHRPRRA